MHAKVQYGAPKEYLDARVQIFIVEATRVTKEGKQQVYPAANSANKCIDSVWLSKRALREENGQL